MLLKNGLYVLITQINDDDGCVTFHVRINSEYTEQVEESEIERMANEMSEEYFKIIRKMKFV